jgi:seipin
MLSLTLLSSNHDPSITSTPLLSPDHTLFTSRRPAILPYTSPLISISSKLVALPLYIWGWKREEEHLEVRMGEMVGFERGWKNIPRWVLLEVEAGNGIQLYDVHVRFKARFSGVRWAMYNHRILSFVVGVGVFWGAECLFTLLAFVGIQVYFSPRGIEQGDSKGAIDGQAKAEIEDGDGDVKEEETDDEPDLSDTPRTFPTYGRQAPLRYEPRVKDEESEEEVLDDTAIQPLEADDEESGEEVEEDEAGLGIDSGIGTSFSEGGVRAGGVARRRSRGGKA